jgi:hypothetical protein
MDNLVLWAGAAFAGAGLCAVGLQYVLGKHNELKITDVVYDSKNKSLSIYLVNLGSGIEKLGYSAIRQRAMTPVGVPAGMMRASSSKIMYNLLSERKDKNILQPAEQIHLAYPIHGDMTFDGLEYEVNGQKMHLPIPRQEEVPHQTIRDVIGLPLTPETPVVAYSGAGLSDFASPAETSPPSWLNDVASMPPTPIASETIAPPAEPNVSPTPMLDIFASEEPPLGDVPAQIKEQARHDYVTGIPPETIPPVQEVKAFHAEHKRLGVCEIILSKDSNYTIDVDGKDFTIKRIRGEITGSVDLGVPFVEIHFTRLRGLHYIVEQWYDLTGKMLIKPHHLEAMVQLEHRK